MNEVFSELIQSIADGISPISVTGVSDSSRAHLISCMPQTVHKLVISHSHVAARKLFEDLKFFSGEENVLFFPNSELLFYDVEAVGRDIITERLSALDKLQTSKKPLTIVATIDAVLSATFPRELYETFTTEIKVGGTVDLNELCETLVTIGYTREDMVEGKGQFSLRGGILDFFPHYSSMPYRIEFFDTDVDSIRLFDVDSQLTVQKVDSARISPAEEIILLPSLRQEFEEKGYILSRSLMKYIPLIYPEATRSRSLRDKSEYAPDNSTTICEKSRKSSLIYPDKLPNLLDYIDSPTVFFDEPARVAESAEKLERNVSETVAEMLLRGVIPQFDGEKHYICDYNETMERLLGNQVVGISGLSHPTSDFPPKKLISITSKSIGTFHGKMEFAVQAIKSYQKQDYQVIILVNGESRAKNFAQSLQDEGISMTCSPDLDEPPKPGGVMVTNGVIDGGFEYPTAKLAVICDKEIFGADHFGDGRKKGVRRPGRNKGNKIDSFTDLSIGDFVVHQNHGIGEYLGIETKTILGITRDYIRIKYKGDDLLYVPSEQLDHVYKYIGKDGASVRVNKLGGAEWNRAKQRVRAACVDMAKELVELYAARENIQGIAYSPDNEFQRQFDDSFPYEETDDQLISIDEVKKDMQRRRPMDRLLCGDVGYGKTEVALRAAFKAVLDGYQVAYLAPTTILVNQHFNTFRKRMKEFAISVEMLSRFRTPAEQKEIIRKLKSGEIDIIIGTHRLLQKDIEFKKLGFLIVDEEQRFGVAHKERIKEIRKEIDVLTLTATPIPRTLHMSMVGIRDMSVIHQPPKDRYPVGTYVLEYDEQVIKDAIKRELDRGGQVFYLSNRVNGIFRVATKIVELVPEARVGVGHGKMSERELENVMHDLHEGNIDVLVCTTIIETGLDVPNVNTIIIEDADRMGLSQLYQLRGRVGRSNRLAYAYLTFRRDKILTEVAEKRLRAIREFTEFGSGFKIALRDLEIRGAGNLIGAQQHGHMDAVGYDLYCKLLAEATQEARGQAPEKNADTLVDITVNAYIPENYIAAHHLRISAYKRIAAIETEQDLSDTYAELEDRFGDVPNSVKNLMEVALIKNIASKLKITEVLCKSDEVIFKFLPENPPNMQRIVDFIDKFPLQLELNLKAKTPNFRYKLAHKKGDEAEYINKIKIFLKKAFLLEDYSV
ncbi:MAG: transcription-repair coupling factor [Oscillospiraceae bacterium]|nr:transcription-repair coupling factor [Oscillospiraceae bacterium]